MPTHGKRKSPTSHTHRGLDAEVALRGSHMLQCPYPGCAEGWRQMPQQMLDSHVWQTHVPESDRPAPGATFYAVYQAWKQGGPDPFCLPVPEPQPQPPRSGGRGRAGGADPLMQRLGRAAGAAGGRQRANTDPGAGVFGRGRAGARTTSGASVGEDDNNGPTGRRGKVDNLERAKSSEVAPRLPIPAAAAEDDDNSEEGMEEWSGQDLFGDAVE